VETARLMSREYAAWREAIAAADTFKYAKVSGDRDLLRRLWRHLRDGGADPLGIDMLALKDLELGINGLIEKARKFDQLETILNDTSEPDRRVIERLCEAFYDG
jgi:hypothetical protein